MIGVRFLSARTTRLAHADEGSTVMEFAIVAPVLLLLLVGSLDVGHTLYTRAVLQGVVQKAARDSTLQANASQAAADALDAKVRAAVEVMDQQITDSSITISRRYYRDYTAAAAAQFEPFNDTNGDHRCDNGESYTDTNGNGTWDADGADSGQGGAQDKAVYTVSVSFPRLFPIDKVVPIGRNVDLTATTILSNQPYADQAVYAAPVSRICP